MFPKTFEALFQSMMKFVNLSQFPSRIIIVVHSEEVRLLAIPANFGCRLLWCENELFSLISFMVWDINVKLSRIISLRLLSYGNKCVFQLSMHTDQI